jgi:Tetratricopeptide repeat
MIPTQSGMLTNSTGAMRETVLGKEHPSTLMSMNNLALLLSDQGKYEQAEKMHRQDGCWVKSIHPH